MSAEPFDGLMTAPKRCSLAVPIDKLRAHPLAAESLEPRVEDAQRAHFHLTGCS